MSASERPPSRLEALQKRCEAATEGPWRVSVEAGDEWWFGGGDDGQQAVIRPGASEYGSVAVTSGEQVKDAEWIAQARTDLPDLARDFRIVAEWARQVIVGLGGFTLGSQDAAVHVLIDAWLGVPE